MAQALSHDDVKKLLKDPSGKNRADTAAKVATDFNAGILTDQQRRIAEDIFGIMVRDAEVRVRKALSHNLKESLDVPREVALALANDVEQVSLPILQYSKVLTDDDLIQIVRTSDEAKQLAVAKRQTVSEAVVDALIDTHNEEVVSTLVANDGAKISEPSMQRVLDEFGESERVNKPMALRKSLPISVAERLVALVSDRLREHLITHHDLSANSVSDVILMSREKVTLDLIDAESDVRDVRELVSALYHNERLTPSIILRAACLGDMQFFESAVAVLARIPITNARRLIHDKGPIGLTAVLERAELPESLFPAFQAAVEVSRETHYDGGDNDRERFKKRMIERVLTHFEDPRSEIGSGNIEYLLGKLTQLDPSITRAA